MTNIDKFFSAIETLKSGVQCTVEGDITSEDDFNNNIKWNTGVEGENAIVSSTNPHSEITWAKVKAEMDKL
tara:strand:+ start:3240 stop:3452 length:213 start_codon:yes stop_codon:yes gene_type:complete